MTTYLNSFASAKIGGRRRIGIAAAIIAAFCFTGVSAQAPVAPSSASVPQSAAELENLVGRIALYPDDLIAVILPASTFPLQIVQADRFLDKRKADPKLKYDEGWDDSVKTLLNYPEIVKTMSSDLDWTSDLGEAVVADQGEVLAAIQTFRRKTQAAGNLKSNDKQVVIVEKEVIKIVPADPQVIYVPQYNPTTVVVYGYPSYAYYPPYPSYYYPYPPGAALATGIIFGAAIGAAWGGNHYGWGGGNDINVNRNTNINTGNINNGNINRGNAGGNSSNWKSNKQSGQVGSSVGKTSSTRGAGYGSGGSAGGARGSQTGASAGSMGGRGTGAGSSAASQNLSGMGSTGAANRSAGGGNSSFGGYGSGRQTGMDSSRGASSRGSMSGGGRSMGGGGGRSMGGGGGRGGGGRR